MPTSSVFAIFSRDQSRQRRSRRSRRSLRMADEVLPGMPEPEPLDLSSPSRVARFVTEEETPNKLGYTMSGKVSIPIPDVGMISRGALVSIRDRVSEIKTEPSWPMDLGFTLLGVSGASLVGLLTWGPVRDSLSIDKQNHYAWIFPLLW